MIQNDSLFYSHVVCRFIGCAKGIVGYIYKEESVVSTLSILPIL
jgi:hypothetical protein